MKKLCFRFYAKFFTSHWLVIFFYQSKSPRKQNLDAQKSVHNRWKIQWKTQIPPYKPNSSFANSDTQ